MKLFIPAQNFTRTRIGAKVKFYTLTVSHS
jgi:hypothetical protein